MALKNNLKIKAYQKKLFGYSVTVARKTLNFKAREFDYYFNLIYLY